MTVRILTAALDLKQALSLALSLLLAEERVKLLVKALTRSDAHFLVRRLMPWLPLGLEH
ncbi:MAG: hypothetical protein ACJATP_001285 [Candidatus Azotimanducaceae bacterium]